MIGIYRQILALLDRRERRQFFWLIGLTVLMGLFDMLGVASILPFLALVSNPGAIDSNPLLATLYAASGLETVQGFMILLGVAVFLFVLCTTCFRAFTFYALTAFSQMRTLTLASRLLERYLGQPYVWFLGRRSADLGKSVLSEVAQVVNGPLSAAMRLIASSVMIACLVGFLLLLQPYAALGAALLFGGSYGLIFVIARARLGLKGEDRVVANREKHRIVAEAMGGIKTVKLMGLERSYIAQFQAPAAELARSQAALAIISELPRHLLEVIAFGGMILFVLWLLATQGSMAEVVPILGVYALAAARIFPTIQQLFAALSALRYGAASLDELHAELMAPVTGDLGGVRGPALRLRQALVLEDVGFGFPGAAQPALNGLSLTIPARTTVGIVGATGAGKTTAVDLILGLLAPQSGVLRVDGQAIGPENLRSWQASVGYVPQEIYLVDDSVAANIAFGCPAAEIDRAAVIEAARVADLHGFVTRELPEGYDTLVGERGTRLSGGQRQRIGIARAIYRNPDLLVFDEATSALDNLTERAVMQALGRLGHSKTIVLIAHRLTTVRACDVIFLMEAGRVVASGSYAELLEQSPAFRALHFAAG